MLNFTLNNLLFLIENIIAVKIIPIKAPWNDIPPSQTLIISDGFEI